MPTPSASELKKALINEGFEIYRTLGEHVLIAERVRDNLIMDSGVAAVAGEALRVEFRVRAQGNDFPGESEAQLFERARKLARTGIERGYSEVETSIVPIRDPGDRTRTLDTWYEVVFHKDVSDTAELFDELRHAIMLEKTASRG